MNKINNFNNVEKIGGSNGKKKNIGYWEEKEYPEKDGVLAQDGRRGLRSVL